MEHDEAIEFDRLCESCTKLFDHEAQWKDNILYQELEDDRHYHHHLDIHALESSANAGCHLCNLIFGQIDSLHLEQMHKDIDEAFVSSSRQIGILIQSFGTYYKAQIYAWMRIPPAESDLECDNWTSNRNHLSWSRIAVLDLDHEEDDYTNIKRSTSSFNCANATLWQIAQWMRECVTSHYECFDVQTLAATRDILPLRLLDLSSTLPPDFIKLITCEELPPHTVYATLSHCWGGDCKTTLTTNSLSLFQAGFHLNALPNTFQHAVIMTRNLGIRYLWIDALCILQNSTQEWFHEASIMGDIYANSTLTISATNSINSDGGLYYSRTPLSVWPCRIEATWTCFPSKKMVMKTRGWAAEKAMKPLGDRGWAFQEWLLSKRTIHFSKDQVRWQCHCLAASEVYPEGVDSELYGVPTKNLIRLLKESDNPKILWLRIRQEFSKKSLTVASDRLAAFSGIARMVFKVMNWPEENFVAGLSRPELLIELLWVKSEYPTKMNSPQSAQYIAPSWSWISVDGPYWDYRQRRARSDQLHAYVNILEARTFLCDDAFGPVTGGHLNVRCTLWSVELMYFPRADGDAANRKWKAIFQDAISLTHEWSNASLDNVPHTRSSPPIRRTFYYMPIMSRVQGLEERNCDLVGLLLEKDADHHHQYRRTGMLELFEIEQKTLLASSVGLVNMDSAEARSMDASRLCTIDII